LPHVVIPAAARRNRHRRVPEIQEWAAVVLREDPQVRAGPQEWRDPEAKVVDSSWDAPRVSFAVRDNVVAQIKNA
jgi:hypothetical protein